MMANLAFNELLDTIGRIKLIVILLDKIFLINAMSQYSLQWYFRLMNIDRLKLIEI